MERTSRLLIKGMVCNRCIQVLYKELSGLGLEISGIRLGEVMLKETDMVTIDEQTIRTMLKKNGFDLLYSRNQQLMDKIKSAVDEGILQQLNTGDPVRFSAFISGMLHKDYDSLSFLFSSCQGYTLEQFIISRKVEKVKELLVYTDQSLSDIAYSLGYSSPAHLSNQLKKHTGFTSSYYKQIRRDKVAIREKQSDKE